LAIYAILLAAETPGGRASYLHQVFKSRFVGRMNLQRFIVQTEFTPDWGEFG
jgi:hypothetical protein